MGDELLNNTLESLAVARKFFEEVKKELDIKKIEFESENETLFSRFNNSKKNVLF